MSFFSENPVTISIAGGLVAATFTFRYASKLFNRQPATALITQPEEPTPAEPNVDAKTWPYATYAYNKEQDGPFYKWIDKRRSAGMARSMTNAAQTVLNMQGFELQRLSE